MSGRRNQLYARTERIRTLQEFVGHTSGGVVARVVLFGQLFRRLVLGPLDQEGRICDRGVATTVVEVQVGVDHVADVAGRETYLREPVDDRVVLCHHRLYQALVGGTAERRVGVLNVYGVHASVDQHPTDGGIEERRPNGGVDGFPFSDPGRQHTSFVDAGKTERQEIQAHLLYRSHRQPADQVPSYQDSKDYGWENPYRRGREHLSVLHAKGAEELRDHRRKGLRNIPSEHKRVEELVPREDEHEDPGSHQPRHHQRQRNTAKHAQRREAIQQPSFLDLGGHLLEKTVHEPNREREVVEGVDEQHADVGTRQRDARQQQEQGHREHHRGSHAGGKDEEQNVVAHQGISGF